MCGLFKVASACCPIEWSHLPICVFYAAKLIQVQLQHVLKDICVLFAVKLMCLCLYLEMQLQALL